MSAKRSIADDSPILIEDSDDEDCKVIYVKRRAVVVVVAPPTVVLPTTPQQFAHAHAQPVPRPVPAIPTYSRLELARIKRFQVTQTGVVQGYTLAGGPAQQPRNATPTSLLNRLHIGTSGFSFKWWHPEHPASLTHDTFYTHGTKGLKELPYYLAHFSDLELNSSFYTSINAATWSRWQKMLDEIQRVEGRNVQFAPKAHRYLTHMKKFKIDAQFHGSLLEYCSSIKLLGNHLGPIIFQFADSFKFNTGRLDAMQTVAGWLAQLGLAGKMVVELRDPSWWREDVYAVFRECNICLAHIHVTNPALTPWLPNFPHSSSTWQPPHRPLTSTSLIYLRFHGSRGQYLGGYSSAFISETVDWIAKNAGEREVWMGWNNTDDGWPANATVDSGRMWVECERRWGVDERD